MKRHRVKIPLSKLSQKPKEKKYAEENKAISLRLHFFVVRGDVYIVRKVKCPLFCSILTKKFKSLKNFNFSTIEVHKDPFDGSPFVTCKATWNINGQTFVAMAPKKIEILNFNNGTTINPILERTFPSLVVW